VKIGNFTADGIRGKDYLNYPVEMQVGILLHRRIDSFTDEHELFKTSSRRLYKNYSHYSRVIVDIYYDHFLARNWSQYSEESLSNFVGDFYQLVNFHYELLPPKFKHLTPHMISGNWLEGYAQFEGIESVLKGMDRRTGMKSKMSFATEDLKSLYPQFKEDFELFFKDLKSYAHDQLQQLELEYHL